MTGNKTQVYVIVFLQSVVNLLFICSNLPPPPKQGIDSELILIIHLLRNILLSTTPLCNSTEQCLFCIYIYGCGTKSIWFSNPVKWKICKGPVTRGNFFFMQLGVYFINVGEGKPLQVAAGYQTFCGFLGNL